MTRPPDLVSVLEALYAEVPFEDWWRGWLRALRPHVDDGFGLAVFLLRRRQDGTVEWLGERALGPCAQHVELLRPQNEAMPVEFVRRFFGGPIHAETASEMVPIEQLERTEAWTSVARTVGYRDSLGLVAVDARRLSLSIAVPLREVRRYGARDRRPLLRITTHIAAAFRLRSLAAGPEAVLSPDGSVLHAEGEARSEGSRSCLREAVRSTDRARTRAGRAAGADALGLWRGLVEGRWSLIERFEADGRRFYVARPNELRDAIDLELTARERQVVVLAATGHSNKSIGYALGLSPSSVATHLKSAGTRLGTRNRVELVRVLAPLLELAGTEPRSAADPADRVAVPVASPNR